MAKPPRTRTVTAERMPPSPSGIYAMRPSGVLVPATSPAAGPVARLAAGSYRAADNPRRRFTVLDGSGDFHLDERTRMLLRSQSRDLERNNTFYDGLLSNTTVLTIGSGPRPIFRSQSEEFNKAALALFLEDAAACLLDTRRLFPWPIWCAMLLRCVLRDGDAGVIHQDDGSSMLLESERITDVKMDAIGRILSYTVAETGFLGMAPLSNQGIQIPAYQMSLPAHRNRPSQTRGLPVASATLDEWERLDSLNEAEIISAESAALPWIVIQSQAGVTSAARPPSSLSKAGTSPGPSPMDGWVRTDAGSMLGLPPGLDGKPWVPNRPNLDVPAFVRMQLRNLSLPVMPYEVAFCDMGDLNYAAIRAMGKMAQRKISDSRTLLLEPTITRVARDWARVQILRKRLPFVRDFHRLEWDWDQLEIRDREKDATAVEREMANGTTTLQDVLGPQWRDTVIQRDSELTTQAQSEIERVAAVQAACDVVNRANPNIRLHWSHIITMSGAQSTPGAYLTAAAPPPTAAPEPAPSPAPTPAPAADPAPSSR